MNNPSDCDTPRRPYLLARNDTLRAALFFRPRCKLWSCPYCASVNRGLWAVRAFMGSETLVTEGYELSFLTLTSHPDLDAAGTLYAWPHQWSVLRQRAYRKAGQFRYILVPEKHKDGRLHIHAIESANLGERWWKDNAPEAGLGYIVDESVLKSPAGAAWYVSKYISKTLEHADWPARFRRVRTSQNWPKLPAPEQARGWDFSVIGKEYALAELVAEYKSEGYVIKIANAGEAWAWLKLVDLTENLG